MRSRVHRAISRCRVALDETLRGEKGHEPLYNRVWNGKGHISKVIVKFGDEIIERKKDTRIFIPSVCSRHNDLPWNIRKFLKNQLREFRFDDLRDTHPWSRSAWSHTDLRRLKEGMVAAQVRAMITATKH